MKKSKRIWISLFAICMPLLMSAQEGTTEENQSDTASQVIEEPDTYKISMGRTKVLISSKSKDKKEKKININKQRHNHFAGIDFGVNGLMSPTNSFDLQKEGEFMDLNYRKSLYISINFWEHYFEIVQEKFGIATGLGIEFNNYALSRNVSIYSDDTITTGVQDPTKDIEKNRLKTEMINLPLMLETNIGKDADHSFHLAIGGMLSYRLGSKTKQIFDQGGKEFKAKSRSDFNMNPFRFNLVARVGYGNFTLYGSYSLTAMYDNEGPELYPFTIGVSLVSF